MRDVADAIRRLVLPAALLAVAGCVAAPAAAGESGPAPRESLARQGAALVAGHWQGEWDRLEFFPGGAVLLAGRWPPRALGRFEFVEPGRMLVAFEGMLMGRLPDDLQVKRTADTLSLCQTGRPNRCMRYVRAPRPADLSVDPRDPPLRLAETADPGTLPPEVLEQEAMGVLRHVFTLQETHRAEHGRHAATMQELEGQGWVPPTGLLYFHPPVVGSAAAGELCVSMKPLIAELWTVHVDHRGRLGRGDC